MSEFRTGTGADLFAPGKPDVPELVITDGQTEGMTALIDVARQANPGSRVLPSQENTGEWVEEQRTGRQELLGTLSLSGLGDMFQDPGFMIGFSVVGNGNEKPDLPVSALLEYMDQEEMLVGGKGSWTDWLRGFQSAQLPQSTGGVLLPSKKLQYRGDSFSTMHEKTEVLSNKVSKVTNGKYGAAILGIIINLQRYTQDPDYRAELKSEGGLGTYTPDKTAGGCVAGLDDWDADGRVYRLDWNDDGNPSIGSSFAVVEKQT